MKPVNIVVLLLAGALGGAVIMKVAHQMRPSVSPHPSAVMAQVQPPATAPAEQPEPPEQASTPAPAPPPVETQPAPPPVAAAKPASRPMPHPPAQPQPQPRKPSPFETVKPRAAAAPEPVAQVQPAPAPQPAAPPTSPTMAPPPVSAEPEHVTPAPPPAPVPPAPPQPHQVTLNAGLLLPVRLIDGLSSARNVPGDVFTATLDRELVVDGFVIAERGARVEGRVIAADRRTAGALALELTRLHTADGQAVSLETESFFKHSEPKHQDAAAKIGGGAILGAVIGAIAGGGKGAAIGAGVGAGAEGGAVLLDRGHPAELSSETVVNFRLKTAVGLTEKLN